MKVPPWIEMPRSAQAGGAPSARGIFLANLFSTHCGYGQLIPGAPFWVGVLHF